MDPVALLLADRSPALRYRALVEVDGAGVDDPEVIALARDLEHAPEIAKAAASARTGDGREVGYALCRLAYLGARKGNPAVDAIADQLFAMQRRDGSWPIDRRRDAESSEYEWSPVQTAVPLRGLAAAGFATDPRCERAYDWLLERRLDDGSWPTGVAVGQRRWVAGYRRLPRSEGCRSSTTAAIACLVHHPGLSSSDEVRTPLDLLLTRETRDEWTIGYEAARLLGVEPARGFITFYARFDLAWLFELATRAGFGLDDRRLADLADFLMGLRGEYGLWDNPLHPQLGRWLSLDLLASFRRLENSDWAGIDMAIPFRPYPAQRHCY